MTYKEHSGYLHLAIRKQNHLYWLFSFATYSPRGKEYKRRKKANPVLASSKGRKRKKEKYPQLVRMVSKHSGQKQQPRTTSRDAVIYANLLWELSRAIHTRRGGGGAGIARAHTLHWAREGSLWRFVPPDEKNGFATEKWPREMRSSRNVWLSNPNMRPQTNS